MKAIQVLKNCLKYSDYGNDIEEKEYIRKAIAELEALENRSCESCKYSKDIFSYTYPLCTEDENNPFQIHNIEKLKCNKWKNKC